MYMFKVCYTVHQFDIDCRKFFLAKFLTLNQKLFLVALQLFVFTGVWLQEFLRLGHEYVNSCHCGISLLQTQGSQ